VALVPMEEIFTPGGQYRRDMDYRGRRVRVREADGFHLTPAGSRIASDFILPELRRFGAI
jgi:hypothetical protein